MGAAFGWGIVAASSLVIGSLIAIWFKISLRAIGLIMSFGAGVLISAVAFDLVEGQPTSRPVWARSPWASSSVVGSSSAATC